MFGGSASSIYYPLNWSFLHCVSKFSLNTLWVIHSSRSSSQNASWLMSLEILKGPYLFWSSFFEGQFKWMFLASNHTLFPAFNPCRFYLFLLNCLFIAFFAISINFLAFFQLLCNLMRNSSNFENSIGIVKFSFQECLP